VRSDPPKPPARRAPPPPASGLEAEFLERALQSDTPLVLTLRGERRIRGILRSFDRDQLTLEDGPRTFVVRKSDIRYLHEEV
jgi:hypothetical protein